MSGVTCAHFKSDGNTPEDSEMLKILVITGTNVPTQFFSKEVGIGSNLQDLLDDDEITLRISSGETVSQLFNVLLQDFVTDSVQAGT